MPSQRAKSISDEDSYKRGTITQLQQVQQQLERLTSAVLLRAAQRLQQHSEAATTLRLGVRHRAADSRKTRQCRLPLQLLLQATGSAEQQQAAVAGVQTLLWALFDKLSLRVPYDISLISVGFADFQHAAVRQQSSSSTNGSSSSSSSGTNSSTSTQSAMSKFLCKSPAADSTTGNSTGSSCAAATANTNGATARAAETRSTADTSATAGTTDTVAAASQERWDERMTIVTIAANCVRHCRDCGARVAVDDLQAHAQWHVRA